MSSKIDLFSLYRKLQFIKLYFKNHVETVKSVVLQGNVFGWLKLWEKKPNRNLCFSTPQAAALVDVSGSRDWALVNS